MQAIFPGTFDPFTRGHLDLITRAAKLFTHLIVAVNAGHSSVKKPLFSIEERLALLKEELHAMHTVELCTFSGLLVDFAKKRQVMTIVRGIRDGADCDYELQMAHMNACLSADFEVILLPTKPEYGFVRASWVRQIATFGGDINAFVTPKVAHALKDRLAS